MNKGVSFMDNDGLTQYMRIAISVAERIAAGELREGGNFEKCGAIVKTCRWRLKFPRTCSIILFVLSTQRKRVLTRFANNTFRYS